MKEKIDILKVNDLEIGFRKRKKQHYSLLSGIMVNAFQGEFITLIGPNGIGKSTFLKTLMRLLMPLSGNIVLFNSPLWKFTRHEFSRMVGYVSTEIIRVGNLTVYDLISLGRFPYTNWLGSLNLKDREAIDHALEMVGLQNLRNRNITEISDGERQRAMIARTVAQDTEILILDEPTAFLDLPNRYEVLHLLRNLSLKKGKTVIFSTHDLDLVMNQADKIWMMTECGVLQGAPEDLALKNTFDHLFPNSRAVFDIETGRFTFPAECYAPVKLTGKGNVFLWTKRALQRNGFLVNNPAETDVSIHAFIENGNYFWELKMNNEVHSFGSIYELIEQLSGFSL